MKLAFSFTLLTVCFLMFLSSCSDSGSEPVLTFQEQWVKDTTAIGSHLRSKNINALTDATGVRFVIDSVTTGFPPRSNSTVTFDYKGKFLSGTIFDEGAISGVVGNFIGGFQVALSLLPEGSKGRFYIPSGYAYGVGGASGIPPNANLMFEITLKAVEVTETEKQKLASDTVAIDQYLATNAINAIRDKSGLRYVINELGTGLQPDLYSKIKINYTGKLISNGAVFFTGTNQPSDIFDSRVINYLRAFHVALPKFPVGTKATLYIPSGLGLGTQSITSGTVAVPANSNLIYDVELVAIVD